MDKKSFYYLMSNISKLLSENTPYAPIIAHSSSTAELLNTNTYLVGGFVRDMLLNKKLIDIDLMVEGDACSRSEFINNKPLDY